MMGSAKITGNILAAAGSLMIMSALGLLMFNIRSSNHAGSLSQDAVQSFIEHVEEIRAEEHNTEPEITDIMPSGIYSSGKAYDDNREESYFEKDGIRFCAVITVPAAETELPVSSDFSMEIMKNYPCRYSGTAAGDDLIIAAHNYDSHFGRLKNLQGGDEIYLTDAAGKVTVYTVTETEVIPGTETGDMKSGAWDLTLFTCDLSGKNRITVRCVRKKL